MNRQKTIYPLIVFVCSLGLSLSNANFRSLGFADAAEFALLSDLAGVAHAPGFPAYILLSSGFAKVMTAAGFTHISALVIFSALCVSLASLILYHTSYRLLKNSWPELNDIRRNIISMVTGLAPVTGTTIWHWSHSVEVYALQVLAAMMVLHGMVLRETGEVKKGMLLAGTGIGLGMANHHLSMLLLIPFMAMLWKPGWMNSVVVLQGKRKPTSPYRFTWKELQPMMVPALLIMSFCYGWMIYRAGIQLPYAFGQPDTFDRLLYHLSGGAWMKNTTVTVKGIVGMRTPYFLRISFEQFFFAGVLIVLGIIYLYTSRRNRFWLSLFGYYTLVLVYQLRIDQTTDTDAYLCAPFFLLFALAPFGMARVSQWYARAFYFLPLIVILQAVIHFGKTDQRDMDLSSALMNDLDKGCPQGAIVLIADWTNVINYHYARIHDGFRKDLCVLNYDLKFTHYEIFKRNYPDVYRSVAGSYDNFIRLLEQYHPQEIFNTGCTLDQPELLNAYLQVIRDLQRYAKSRNVPFMADPKAYVFLAQQGLFPDAHVSGSYLANRPGTGNEDFLKFNHRWIHNKHVMMDPAASDKLVDLEAAFDLHRRYWQQTGNTANYQLADQHYTSIKRMQNKMKKKMAFLFRPAS